VVQEGGVTVIRAIRKGRSLYNQQGENVLNKIKRRIRLMKRVVSKPEFYNNLVIWLTMSGFAAAVITSSLLDKAVGICVSFAGVYVLSFFEKEDEQ
jgi:arginine repressor